MTESRRFKNQIVIKGYNEGVTGSAIRCIVERSFYDKFRFLVDFGFYQGAEYEELSYNDTINPSKLDAVFLTHNHFDHAGALPLLAKKGYRNKIYTSIPTSELLGIAYDDSLSIFAERIKEKSKGAKMIYNSGDVSKTLNLVKPMRYQKTINLAENLTAILFENQHLVGASMVLVRSKVYDTQEVNILFTGDYNNKNSFLENVELPEWVYRLKNLTIVTEATYGDTDTCDIKHVWADNVTKACQDGKSILLLCFAQGRFQEMLYQIKCMQEKGKIPSDYLILADGKSGIQYSFSYAQNKKLRISPEMKNFFPSKIEFVNNKNRQALLHTHEKKIIVSTSGMGNFGPARTYIPEMLPLKNSVIHFSGYTAEGTLGRKLQELECGESISISGITIPKRAEIYNTSEFSSHAKADELIAFIKKFSNVRSVLVTHGEPKTKEKFAKRVVKETSVNKVGVLGNGYSYRIGPYGIIKSIQD